MAIRLGDRLVGAGLAKRDDVERAADVAEEEGRRIGEVLCSWGLVGERDVYRCLAAQRELAFADAESFFDVLDRESVRRLPRERQNALGALPLGEEGERLRVAVSDPELDIEALAGEIGCEVEGVDPVLVTPTDLRRLQWSMDLDAKRPPTTRAVAEETDLLREDVRDQTAAAALLDAVLAEAVAQRASDIHVEPSSEGARIRLRVDGELRDCEHFEVGPDLARALVNIVKVRGSLDITERRRPQDGRWALQVGGHHFDLRLQTQPTLHGEAAVLRLLSPDERLLTIDRLGFREELQSAYQRVLESPSGLVLVAGPTGSGKSTTLYAGLQLLAADRTRKVISVEDPIEYEIDGVQQTQMDEEHDFGFSRAVRTLVREDPDVIMIGEVRDPETALEALRASQTGHLVLATIHANDAVDAVQRLFDLGMHPNSVAAELLAVVGQRLAKRLCPSCRVPWEPDRALLRDVFPRGVPEGFRAFRGEGCEPCRGFGTRGRLCVGELLPSTRGLRATIARRAPLDELRGAALDAGLHTMRDEALALVGEGAIALEELPRLFYAEMLAGWVDA